MQSKLLILGLLLISLALVSCAPENRKPALEKEPNQSSGMDELIEIDRERGFTKRIDQKRIPEQLRFFFPDSASWLVPEFAEALEADRFVLYDPNPQNYEEVRLVAYARYKKRLHLIVLYNPNQYKYSYMNIEGIDGVDGLYPITMDGPLTPFEGMLQIVYASMYPARGGFDTLLDDDKAYTIHIDMVNQDTDEKETFSYTIQ